MTDNEHRKKVVGSETCTMKKRAPQRASKHQNDVYVNRKSDFKYQLEHCQKLLDSSHQAVWIHGLGAAINRAINLALQLKHRGMGTVEISAQTSSVQLIDDFEPQDDEHEGFSRVRTNSGIHIKVYKVSATDESKNSQANSGDSG